LICCCCMSRITPACMAYKVISTASHAKEYTHSFFCGLGPMHKRDNPYRTNCGAKQRQL
jgi:hypothetical protein